VFPLLIVQVTKYKVKAHWANSKYGKKTWVEEHYAYRGAHKKYKRKTTRPYKPTPINVSPAKDYKKYHQLYYQLYLKRSAKEKLA
jgi:hypothetical protein